MIIQRSLVAALLGIGNWILGKRPAICAVVPDLHEIQTLSDIGDLAIIV